MSGTQSSSMDLEIGAQEWNNYENRPKKFTTQL
jgi:hypothetical protein